jgi:hypothetical protein
MSFATFKQKFATPEKYLVGKAAIMKQYQR